MQGNSTSPCQEVFSSSLSAFALCWVRLVPRFLPQRFEAMSSEGKSLRSEAKRHQAALSFFRSKLFSLESLEGSGSCTVCRERQTTKAPMLAPLHVREQEPPATQLAIQGKRVFAWIRVQLEPPSTPHLHF